jgi:hypothetical protein
MADVLSFFQGAAFDDDATQVMGKAFDRACQSLHDNGQPDLVRQIIAKRIIEVARKGERDPDELCARALQALGFRIRQIASSGAASVRGRGAGFTRAAAAAPVMLCVDVLGFHIGFEPCLELAHQRGEAGHAGDRTEQRP